MTGWTDVVMTHLTPWPIGVLMVASAISFLFGAIGLWSLWRVQRLLKVVPQVHERLETLSNSLSLLTDTTESCFKALSMQFQFLQSQGVRVAAPAARPRTPLPLGDPQLEAGARKARQRRVVGAARRGEGVAEIAAREDVAESEVMLRLHVNREQPHAAETKRYGSLLS